MCKIEAWTCSSRSRSALSQPWEVNSLARETPTRHAGGPRLWGRMGQGFDPRLHVGRLEALIVVLIQLEVPSILPRGLELHGPSCIGRVDAIDGEGPLPRIHQVEPLDRTGRVRDQGQGTPGLTDDSGLGGLGPGR